VHKIQLNSVLLSPIVSGGVRPTLPRTNTLSHNHNPPCLLLSVGRLGSEPRLMGRHHSTESAIVKVMSDILDAADSRQVTLLGLLDLIAAFDTVDHQILLQRLKISFGIGGQVLQWLESFITHRVQAVVFRGVTSKYVCVEPGVPQRTVLGPLLFLLYTADVAAVARAHGVGVHCCADDTQLYTSCLWMGRRPRLGCYAAWTTSATGCRRTA